MMHKNPISSLSRLFSVGVRKRTEFSSAFWGRLSAAWGAALVRPDLEERPNHTKPQAPHKSIFVASFHICGVRRLAAAFTVAAAATKPQFHSRPPSRLNLRDPRRQGWPGVIPTEATAPSAVAQWRDRGKIYLWHSHS